MDGDPWSTIFGDERQHLATAGTLGALKVQREVFFFLGGGVFWGFCLGFFLGFSGAFLGKSLFFSGAFLFFGLFNAVFDMF